MRLLIRADATPGIGAGHVMRCATLAEAWIDAGFGPAVLSGEITLGFAGDRVREAGASHAGTSWIHQTADVVLVDSYNPNIRAELSNTSARFKALVDDVGGWTPPGTDLVWNPNPYGRADLYSGFTGMVLTGDQCVPIRNGLPTWTVAACAGTAVTLGGSSLPDPVLNQVISALSEAVLQPIIGVGDWVPANWARAHANQPWNQLSKTCRALVGAGTSTMEAAAIGIPTVVVCFADNQRLAYDWAVASGAVAVDFHDGLGASGADLLLAALEMARPLPRLQNGAPRVAAQLHALAQQRLMQ